MRLRICFVRMIIAVAIGFPVIVFLVNPGNNYSNPQGAGNIGTNKLEDGINANRRLSKGDLDMQWLELAFANVSQRLYIFKEASAYFYRELSTVKLYLIGENSIQMNQQVHLLLTVKSQTTGQENKFDLTNYFEASRVYSHPESPFSLLSIEIRPGLTVNANAGKVYDSFLQSAKSDQVTMHLTVADASLAFNSMPAIGLKARHFNSSPERSMVCTQCSNLNQGDGLSFWLSMNKRLGFSKINICSLNGSGLEIDDHKFDNNYVQLTKLDSWPPLGGLREFESIRNDAGFRVFNSYMLSSCFIEHASQYGYVALLDTNQLVLPYLLYNNQSSATNLFEENRWFFSSSNPSVPKSFGGLTCDRLGVEAGNRTAIGLYLNDLTRQRNPLRTYDMYLLRKHLVDKINFRLDDFFHGESKGAAAKIDIATNFVNVSKYQITFIVSSTEGDREYAKRMVDFLNAQYADEWLKNKASKWDRFIALKAQRSSDALCGRLFNTQAHFLFDLCFSDESCHQSDLEMSRFSQEYSKFVFIPETISYFETEEHDFLSKPVNNFTFTDLIFDFNRLKCLL